MSWSVADKDFPFHTVYCTLKCWVEDQICPNCQNTRREPVPFSEVLDKDEL